MKVSGLGSVKSSGGAKKRGAVSSASSFADLLGVSGGSGADAADGTAQINAVAPVSNLLAAQEVSGGGADNSALIKDGEDTLDALEKLRRQILGGAVSIQTLSEIKSQIIRKKNQTTDPELRAIMDEIELRASVELAKLETGWTNQQAALAEYPDKNDI